MTHVLIFGVRYHNEHAKKVASNLLYYASGCTMFFEPKIRRIEISTGYAPDREVTKTLFIGAKGEDNKDSLVHRYMNALRYCSYNLHAPLTDVNIYNIFGKEYVEVYSPQFIGPAHQSLKKMIRVLHKKSYDEIKNENRLSVMDIRDIVGSERVLHYIVVPYSIVALNSGVHRHGLAMRQVAFQTLFYLRFKHLFSSSFAIGKSVEIIDQLMSAIILDTCLWIPYAMYLKVGAMGSEHIYSIASSSLRDLIESYYDAGLLRHDVIVGLARGLRRVVYLIIQAVNNYLNALYEKHDEKHGLSDLLKKYSKRAGIPICNKVIDTLIKRSSLIASTLTDPGKEIKPNENGTSLLFTVTEQANILQLELFLELMNNKGINIDKVILLFTPETTFTATLLEQLAVLEYNKINIEPILIPTMNGSLVKTVANAIVSKYSGGLALAFLQGGLSYTLPLYNALLKKGFSKEAIIFM